MNERLLHFIWQFRYYSSAQLQTTTGEPVEILSAGEPHHNQGPDFLDARIKIGDTTWAGTVELHVKSSDWEKHAHSEDPNFARIILHVVWEHDTPNLPGNHPVLELQHRVSKLMLDQYQQWISSKRSLPCAGQLKTVPGIVLTAWFDRMLTERLQSKTDRIAFHLQQTNNHWEEVCWRMVCRYFGTNINADSFEQIAVSVPLTVLAKHKNQIHQLEALLLGQAAIVHKNLPDDYGQMLYKEYQFLQKKYGLRVVNKPPLFLRLRPVNFPSIRLAQLAMLIHKRVHLFSRLLEATALKDVYELFDVTANDYWNYHFKPGVPADFLEKHIGKQTVDILIINAIAPLLFAYGKGHGEERQVDKAMNWLQQIAAEKNHITQVFKLAGVAPKSAAQSQAMLHLKEEYCNALRCLECAVGNAILKSKQ
jgi:hypothetical protein